MSPLESVHADPSTGRPRADGRAGAGSPLGAFVVTKLVVPVSPRQAIGRPRLFRMLDDGAALKLSLVVAPAGSGKTTLVTGWLAERPGRRVGWLSLDRTDNDRIRFWSYVQAALVRAATLAPIDDREWDHDSAAASSDVMAPLINALSYLAVDTYLVLDDFHLITTDEIHRDLAFLLAQPIRLHLILLSRTDPPIALSRLKANGDVTEIRMRHLAFNRDEMDLFLDDHRVDLAPDLRDAVFHRVGGWAAALRLIVLWVSDRADHSAAVAGFATSDTTITDYLTSEILGQLPEPLRRFLLWTSILPRLSGPLCDEVTGDGNGAPALQELYRRGLFIDSVAPGRDWFTYHHLFADLVRAELQRQYPEMVKVLHVRAANWFAANGFPGDAIEHSLLAEDWLVVRKLMYAQTFSIGSRYQPAAVMGWLSMIPKEVLHASPFFLLVHGFIVGNAGDIQLGKRSLDAASALMENTGETLESMELGALLPAVRCTLARLHCDLPEARRLRRAVERSLAGPDAMLGPARRQLAQMARAVADNALAGTLFWHGQIEAAGQLLDQVERDSARYDLARMRVNCLAAKALVLALTGRLREAFALATEAIELARPVGVSTMFQTNPAHLALAVISLQRGDREGAVEQLALVSGRARRHGDRAPALAADVLRARLIGAAGNTAEAYQLLDEATAAWPGWQLPSLLRALLDREEVRLCLLDGDLVAARAVLARLTVLPDEPPWMVVNRQLNEAWILRAEHSDRPAAAAFTLAADTAASAGLLTMTVEALIGASVAHRSAGATGPALTSLDRALVIAQEEAVQEPFRREAAVLRPLLLLMESAGGQNHGRGFRQRLLDRMGIPATVVPQQRTRSGSADLTDRERTVLRLLRGTLTNTEIADALGISTNTLKTHVKNLYRKLGATNRAQVKQSALQQE